MRLRLSISLKYIFLNCNMAKIYNTKLFYIQHYCNTTLTHKCNTCVVTHIEIITRTTTDHNNAIITIKKPMQYCNCISKHNFQYMIAIAQHMSAIQPYEYINAIYKCYCNTINFIAMHKIMNSNTNILT